jgi:hypothetical protein
MRLTLLHALAAFALLSGCAPKKTVTTKDGVEYLHVRQESLANKDGRASYDGQRMEVVALVGYDGVARYRRGWMIFTIATGGLNRDAVVPKTGSRMMRLCGVYHVQSTGKPVLEVDDAVTIDVPLRTVTLAEVDANPKAFDGAHVTVEGHYSKGPEGLWLGGEKVWVQPRVLDDANEQDPNDSGHLRVEGWLFTRGARYGQTGRGRYTIITEESTRTPSILGRR